MVDGEVNHINNAIHGYNPLLVLMDLTTKALQPKAR